MTSLMFSTASSSVLRFITGADCFLALLDGLPRHVVSLNDLILDFSFMTKAVYCR
jgi:hypothetical protein